jgi:hypothetical protein
VSFKQIGPLDGMREHSGPEQYWIGPIDFIKQMRLPNDTGDFRNATSNITKVINPIRNANSVQAAAKIQEHASLTADP